MFAGNRFAAQSRQGGLRPGHFVLAWALLGLVVAGCQGSLESRLEEARALKEAGQHPEAIEVLREILDEHPDNAQANHLLGAALLETGQIPQAMAPLQRAFESEETLEEAGLLLSSAFLNGQNFEEAIATADRVLQANPDNIAAVRIRAHSYVRTGQWEEYLQDADTILAAEPDDFQGLLHRATALMKLKRFPEAEKAFLQAKEIGVASGDTNVAARGCGAYANYFIEGPQELERAEAAYDECVENYPNNPLIIGVVSSFYDQLRKPDKATAVLEKAVAAEPENLAARQALATRKMRVGEREAAEQLMLEGAELVNTSQAWQMLAQIRKQSGDAQGAYDAVTTASELAGETESLRFSQGDLLVDLDRLDEAQAIANEMELPVYRQLLEGRILLARGDPRAALEQLEQGLLHWPNNAGGRYLAGAAAQELGDVERAVVEYREATRADAAATDAALLAARIQYSLQRYEEAFTFAQRHVSHRGTSFHEAVAIAAQAQAKLGGYEASIQLVDAAARRAGLDARLVSALAEMASERQGPEAAVTAVESLNIDFQDPKNHGALRAVAQLLVDAGRTEEALKRVDSALAKHPDSAPLHEARARVLSLLGRKADARDAAQRALELDPEDAAALGTLAALDAGDGKFDAALEGYAKALELEPNAVDLRYQRAQLLLMKGRNKEAETELRKVVATDPTHGGASNDLAWILAENRQELEFAESLANRAVVILAQASAHDTLGWVQLQRGDSTSAIQSFRKALELEPTSPGSLYRLGLALAASGDSAAALDAYRRALAAGPFAQADDARARIAKLESNDQP